MFNTRQQASDLARRRRSARSVERPKRWRDVNLVAVTAVSAYSAAICWQCQLVSYPLFVQVSADDFPAYHQQYSRSIRGVVILPGFVSFLACAAFGSTKPVGISRHSSILVSAGGVVALVATVAAAIPMHRRLAEIGQSTATIEHLMTANLVRTIAMTAATGLLISLTYARTQPRRGPSATVANS